MGSLGVNTIFCWFINRPPYMEGKERLKKEADHSRLVRGRFNKQGNLQTRLNLVATRWALQPCPPEFKSVYRGLNWVQSHIPSRWSQITHCSLKAASLKQLWLWEWWVEGTWVEYTLQGQGRGWETSNCLGPDWESIGGHVLLMNSSNIFQNVSL